MKRRLAENYRRVRGRIEAACAKAGRDPAEVTLVAITKDMGFDLIRQLIDGQVQDLGESRAQELSKRAAMAEEYLSRRQLDPDAPAPAKPRWHMVGHLQRNKVKMLLPWVELIHSVDTLRLAEEIEAVAAKMNCTVEILLEINAGLEPQKHGVAVAAAPHLAEQIVSLPHLKLTGVMTMAPLDENLDRVHACFARIAEVFEEMRREVIRRPEFRKLSMGMSRDFELAISCGATHVRIGTALLEGVE